MECRGIFPSSLELLSHHLSSNMVLAAPSAGAAGTLMLCTNRMWLVGAACPRGCAVFADSLQVSSCDYCYLFFFFSTPAKNYLALRSLKSNAILKISCVSKYTYLYLMQVDTSLETSEGAICSGHLYMAAHGYVPSELGPATLLPVPAAP